MNVWQIATGEIGRDYRQLFFDYDVMLLGPGTFGDARIVKYADGIPNSAKSQVSNFAHCPKAGDRVLMRFNNEVIGIGEIPKDENSQYSFHESFRCVYGWNIQHCRRVAWAKNVELGGLKTVFRNAKQKPSFTRVHEARIIKKVKNIHGSYFQRSLKALPSGGYDEYCQEELGIKLFKAGVSHKNIEDILKALKQAERLWWWYDSQEDSARPSEHEIVSHMILPIFLGLGWSHQQIAVEWQKIDMAFFRRMPAIPENCEMILESKGWGQALTEMFDQPREYVKRLNLKSVKYILLTDGANIFVYGKSNNEWDLTPVGYVNIWSLQREYLLPKKTNLIKTLVKLQPSML